VGSRLDDPLEAGAVGLLACAADRVGDGVELVALPEGIEGRERQAELRPARAGNQLAPARGAHRGEEVGVLPDVEGRAVDRW
jgi:hypothetical protein